MNNAHTSRIVYHIIESGFNHHSSRLMLLTHIRISALWGTKNKAPAWVSPDDLAGCLSHSLTTRQGYKVGPSSPSTLSKSFHPQITNTRLSTRTPPFMDFPLPVSLSFPFPFLFLSNLFYSSFVFWSDKLTCKHRVPGAFCLMVRLHWDVFPWWPWPSSVLTTSPSWPEFQLQVIDSQGLLALHHLCAFLDHYQCQEQFPRSEIVYIITCWCQYIWTCSYVLTRLLVFKKVDNWNF